MAKIVFGLLFISLIFISSCTNTKYICSDGREVFSSEQCDLCGNSICDKYEDHCSCPNDCEVGRIPKTCPSERPLMDARTLCCVSGCTPGVSC